MDKRCKDRNKVGELRGDIGAFRLALTPSFRKPFDQEINLKIILISSLIEIVVRFRCKIVKENFGDI
jgi:hypothetical protein